MCCTNPGQPVPNRRRSIDDKAAEVALKANEVMETIIQKTLAKLKQ